MESRPCVWPTPRSGRPPQTIPQVRTNRSLFAQKTLITICLSLSARLSVTGGESSGRNPLSIVERTRWTDDLLDAGFSELRAQLGSLQRQVIAVMTAFMAGVLGLLAAVIAQL